ncbi:MAG: DinB family protein [Polaribacter sp.]|nr:DinB family protein [Polaribacter sp.]
MDKDEILDILETKHQELFSWLENQPQENWILGPEKKWSTSQHIQHLADSLQLLNKALSYPRFFLKYKFGICNRESRDYNTIVKKYQQKLLENREGIRNFNKKLNKPTLKEKKRLITKLQIQQKKLQYKTKKISEKNLDSLVIPHPIMGKMTIREIIMWTVYHTEHHTKTLQKFY